MKKTTLTLLFAAALFAVWSAKGLELSNAQVGGMLASAGDANGDGDVNVADAVYTLNYLFAGGQEPVACAHPPPEKDPGDLMAGMYRFTFNGTLTSTLLFHADGTWVVPELEILFGAGLGRADVTAVSPIVGAWKLENPTTVSVIGVHRLFGANGETVGFFKYDGTYTFTPDYSRFTYAGDLFEIGPNDDPWDPAAVPVQVWNNNFGSATRCVVP